MTRPRSICRHAAWLLALGVAGAALGQVTTSELNGRVTDGQDGLPRVTVAAEHLESGEERTTLSNARGQFRLPALRPGDYELRASLDGFATSVRRGVALAVGQVASVELQLERLEHSVDAEIFVVAQAPLLELSQSDRSFRVGDDEIESLPLNSRDAFQFALLAPGVTADRSGANPSFSPLNFGAQNDRGTVVLVDGLDHTNPLFGGLVGFDPGLLPQNAVQQFEVQSGRFNAEHGGTAAGVINLVTRAGTNELAGGLFGLFRDKGLNARNHFEAAKPPYKRQQYGFHVGGPIARDRSHFFAAMERNEEDAFAVVNTGAVFPELEGTFLQPTRVTRALARVDLQLSGTQTLNGRALYMDSSRDFLFGGTVARSGGVHGDEEIASLSAGHTWMASDVLLSELRLGYVDWKVVGRPLSFDPRLVFPSAERGRFPLSPVVFLIERWQLRQDLAYSSSWRGWHRWRFGVNIEREEAAKSEELFASGLFIIPIDIPIPPVIGLVGEGDPDFGSRANTLLGVYVQDDWAVNDRLTLNLGLRYDIETNAGNQDFVSTKTDSALPYISDGTRGRDDNNVAPRLGFAWQPGAGDSMVIRGGYGLYYGRIVQDLPFGEISSDRWRTYTILFPGTTDVSQIDLTGRPYRVDFLLPEGVRTPYSHQLSLGFARQLRDDLVLEVDYFGARGRNEIWSGEDVNPLDPATFSRLAPQFQQVIVARTDGRSSYDALTLVVDKVRGARYSLRGAYTLARARSDFDDPLFASVFGRGPTAWDERHRLVVSGRVLLPYSIEFSGVARLSSGRPYTVFTGTDDNFNGDLTDDLPPGVERNSKRANRVSTVDVRLAKVLQIGRMGVKLIADVYNLFNTTNFDSTSYNGNLSSPNSGRPSVALAPRQVQLGFLLDF